MDADDSLAISGLQHFSFCRRQWALIHIEGLWSENYLTVSGALMHKRAHDEKAREHRGDLIIERGLGVSSRRLGLHGVCDVVEFRQAPNGFPLPGEPGLWSAAPVEYKRGRPKANDADRLQLCAQALCLEEMLCTDIPEGFLYYGQTRSRESVALDAGLRARVQEMTQEMWSLVRAGHTPRARAGRACGSCSLKTECLPSLEHRESVASYVGRHVREGQ